MANVRQLFEAVGVSMKDVDAAIGSSTEIRHAVMEKAEEVKEYWQSIAPVNKTGKPHELTSGYVDDPGDYRDSIRVSYKQNKSGHFTATVGTNDYKAHWLEYGSVHNPEHGFAQRVVDHFGGAVIDNGGDSNTYYVST